MLKRLLLTLLIATACTVPPAHAQAAPGPEIVTTVGTAIGMVFRRTILFTSDLGAPFVATMTLQPGVRQPLEVYALHWYCPSAAATDAVTITDLSTPPTVIATIAPVANTNFLQVTSYVSASGSFRFAFPSCGPGTTGYFWVTYSP
jgi:hypothetical protein